MTHLFVTDARDDKVVRLCLAADQVHHVEVGFAFLVQTGHDRLHEIRPEPATHRPNIHGSAVQVTRDNYAGHTGQLHHDRLHEIRPEPAKHPIHTGQPYRSHETTIQGTKCQLYHTDHKISHTAYMSHRPNIRVIKVNQTGHTEHT